MKYNLVRKLPNGLILERHSECIVPNIVLVANVHQRGQQPIWREKAHRSDLVRAGRQRDSVRGSASSPGRRAPTASPIRTGSRAPTPSPTSGRASLRDRAFEEQAAQARRHGGAGGPAPDCRPCAGKPRNLGYGRRLAASDVAQGDARRCKRGAIRRTSSAIRRKNHALETSCWNTVMTPEQFEQKVKPGIPPGAARRTVAGVTT